MPSPHIVDLIRSRSAPDAVAVSAMGRKTSLGELLEQASTVAHALRSAGDSADPARVRRIGLHFPSGPDYIAAALGVLEADACFVPVPEELADAEKRTLVERTALDAVLTPAGGSEPWLPASTLHAQLVQAGDSVLDLHLVTPGDPVFPEEAFAALNPAFIRFSSGTTGRSKGVVLSHETLKARIEAANGGLRIGPGDRVLWTLPMAHHFAVSIILYLYHGATTILAEARSGAELLEIARSEGATVMYGSPFHFRQLADCDAGADCPTLRLAVSTAAALDAVTARSFQRRFGKPLVQGLGIIEAGLPMLNLANAETKPESIGRPLPGYEAKLRPAGEGAGELLLRGGGFFDAYLDPWQRREDVMDADGWFATGDLAEVDADGDWTLKGRLKSLINVGGMKVFAEEVERVLAEHPGIERALVSGQAHPVFGEIPVARYEAAEEAIPAKELRRHCRERLAAHKVPLTFLAVQKLPQTASGKLRRDPASIPAVSNVPA